MTAAELRQAIAATRRDLLAALSTEGAVVGADAAALIEQRVVEKGQKADGSRLSAYSNKDVPAYLYFGRSRNASGEAAVRKKAKAREGVSYREFRQLNGLNTNLKSLQFTGAMWQGFGVVSVRPVQPGVVVVTLDGKNTYSKTLLGYHGQREGTDVTAPSRDELRLVEQALNERLGTIIKRHLG